MVYFFNFACLIILYFVVFYGKWRRQSIEVFVVKTLMYSYFVMVLFVTLMPLSFPTGISQELLSERTNFQPFRDFRFNYKGATREIWLNIIMTMPFGFLYPILRKSGVIRTVLAAFLFSMTIESAQLLSAWLDGLPSRRFDVTDLITNTCGGFLGYLIFKVLNPLVYKLLKE